MSAPYNDHLRSKVITIALDSAHSIFNRLPEMLLGINESPAKFHADVWYRVQVLEKGYLEYEFHIGAAGTSAPKKRLKGTHAIIA